MMDHRKTKDFMFMVIHEMRNPTVGIKLGLQEVTRKLKESNLEIRHIALLQGKFTRLVNGTKSDR